MSGDSPNLWKALFHMNSTHTFLALIAGVSLAACGEALPDSGPINQTGVSSDTLDLSGHYRISAMGDDPLPHAIKVSFDENAVWWEPACSGQGLSYRPSGANKVTFYDPNDPDELQIVCDIGFPHELTQLWARLAGEHSVAKNADRSLTVDVDGEQWLFEPATDPLPKTLAGQWRVEMIDGLATAEMRETTVFSADDKEIWWNPRCAGKVMAYSMDGSDFEITQGAFTPPPPPEPGQEPIYPPRAICPVGLPTYLVDAIRALESATQVQRAHDNTLSFAGGGHSLALSRVVE